MNKKPFILLTGVIASLFFSCSGDKYEPEDSLAKETTAKLRVAVADYNSNELLAATVTLRSTGESKVIAPPALAEFAGIDASEQQIFAEMDGYASRTVRNANSSNRNMSLVSRDRNEYILLPKLSASLEGYLFTENKDGQKTVPMKDVKVRIVFDKSLNLTESFRETTVGKDGKYSFDSLPAVRSLYEIWFIGAAIDSTLGIDTRGSFGLLDDGVTVNAGKTEYDLYRAKANTPFTILQYTKEIPFEDPTEPVVFKFSNKIDASKTKAKTVKLCKTDDYYRYDGCDGSDVVPANISWSEQGLTITPIDKWSESFYVCFARENNDRLFSVLNQDLIEYGYCNWDVSNPTYPGYPRCNWDGNYTYGDYYDRDLCYNITVIGKNLAEEQVVLIQDSIVFKDNGIYSYLRWSFLPGANKYEVYKKEIDSKAEYALYATVDFNTDLIHKNTDTTFTAVSEGTYLYVVQASNDKTVSKFSNPVEATDNFAPDFNSNMSKSSPDKVVKFRDNDDGNMTTDQFNTKYALYNKLSSSSAQTVANGRVYFNKDMDQKVLPTVSCAKEGASTSPCNKLYLELNWQDAKTLNVVVKTKADNEIALSSDVNGVFSINGLKGKNGVAFKTLYGTAPDTVTKASVEIRFVANACPSNPTIEGCPCDGTNSGACGTYCNNATNINNHWNGACSAHLDPFCGASLSNFFGTTGCYRGKTHCDYFDSDSYGDYYRQGCPNWCLNNEDETGDISSLYDYFSANASNSRYRSSEVKANDSVTVISDSDYISYHCPILTNCSDDPTQEGCKCEANYLFDHGPNDCKNFCMESGNVGGTHSDTYCQDTYEEDYCKYSISNYESTDICYDGYLSCDVATGSGVIEGCPAWCDLNPGMSGAYSNPSGLGQDIYENSLIQDGSGNTISIAGTSNFTCPATQTFCQDNTATYFDRAGCYTEYKFCELFSTSTLCIDNDEGGSNCYADKTATGCICDSDRDGYNVEVKDCSP